jgi:hypothetical protein
MKEAIVKRGHRSGIASIGLLLLLFVFHPSTSIATESEPDAPCGVTYDNEYFDYDLEEGVVVVHNHGGEYETSEGWSHYSYDAVRTHSDIQNNEVASHRFIFWPWHSDC